MTFYSIDSSSLVRAWREAYPIDAFPRIWDCFNRLIRGGKLRASEEVLLEVKNLDEDLYAWLHDRPEIIAPLTRDVQSANKRVLASFPQLIGKNPRRNGADPWVIATAIARGGKVVSEEVSLNRRNKIQDACNALGVSHIQVLELIRLECGNRDPL